MLFSTLHQPPKPRVLCLPAELESASSNWTPAMRYDDWDVILFPKDSQTPIQEFKTACYHVSNNSTECHKAPTLTCYITSLPPATPFKISIHSWSNPARPSAIIEAQKKPSQKVAYIIQVVVDGVRVFHNCYDVASRWPQEIAHEKRDLTANEQPTSERKPRLEFPAFSPQTLVHEAWRPRDPSGRINILLSEQLVNKHDDVDELELGISNDIVCFSFQHAPRDILEQAGISWPIRNPLYLPKVYDDGEATQNSAQSDSGSIDAQDSPFDAQPRSPSRALGPMPRRDQSNDTLQRPRSHPPPVAHLFKPPRMNRSSGRSDIWGGSFGSTLENHDTISLGSWPTQPSGSHPSGDIFGDSHTFISAGAFRPPLSWPFNTAEARRGTKPASDGQQRRQDKQIVVALRDDQLGQIIHAISPPKTIRNLPHDRGAHHVYSGRPPSTQLFNPLTAFVPSNGRPPSAAAQVRKSSYSDFAATQRNMSRKPSLDRLDASEVRRNKATLMSHPSASSYKENMPPSQSRMPIPFPYANRVPTPNPFAPPLSQWSSDMTMKGDSSNPFKRPPRQANRAPVLSEIHNKHGASHAPNNNAGIRGRKEGLISDSRPTTEKSTQHDQSLLAPTTGKLTTSRELRSTATSTPSMLPKPGPAAVEIIDVDAIDPELDGETHTPKLDVTKLSTKPHHKQGTSSTNSLGSVERRVFTYVGAEVSRTESMSHETEQEMDADTDTIAVSLGGQIFETATKRKRRGTVDSQEVRKREKAGQESADEVEEAELPNLTDE